MSNGSIRPIDRTLLGATTPNQSGPGSNDNEGYSTFPYYRNLTIRLFISYLGRSLGKFYPSAEMLSVYSKAPADRANKTLAGYSLLDSLHTHTHTHTHTHIYIYIYIYIYIDSSLKHLTCLATQKSCDTTKQSICGWQYIERIEHSGSR